VRISAVSDYGSVAAHPERRNNILQTGIQYLRSKENRRYEAPVWQRDVFGAAPDKSVAASELARHILIGQKYATEDTVWNSADMEVYRQLEQEYNQATGAAKFELFQKLKRNFPDSTVRIQDGKQTTTEMIPNPYRAASSRHSLVSFAQPVPQGLSVSDKAIVEQNMKVLKKLVPSVMIQDKPMATAILESLWFCGRNPDLRDTPRCFPARLLGEIREWTESRKLQAKQSKLAQEVLDSSDWKAMRTWIDAIKRNWRGFSAASASGSSAGSSSASSGSASSARTGHRSYSMLSSGRPMRSLGEIMRDDGDRFFPYSIIQPIIPGPFRR